MSQRVLPAVKHVPFAASNKGADLEAATLYELLHVAEDCDEAELRAAFKKRALEEHPDKGGDQDRFDEITRAYGVLENAERRDAYDSELSRGRDRARLVVGGPARARQADGEAPVKETVDKTKKTAPHIGSTRTKDWHKCSDQWKGEKSGSAMLSEIRLAIADAEGSTLGSTLAQKDEKEIEKEQTEALWEKFSTLNPGVKKQWLSSLSSKQKQALKARSKVHEEKEREKAQAWLSGKKGKA